MVNNVEIARRIFDEIWNDRKPGAIDGLISPGYVHTDPNTPDLGEGREGYRKLVSIYTTAFPDLHFRIDEIVGDADTDTIAVRWTATGTHQGDLMGIAPTNKRINVAGIVINRFAHGKAVESTSIWDTYGLLRQLGVVPSLTKGKAA